MTLHDLPRLNALLNGTSAVLLVLGFMFIRRRNIPAHRRCMIAAFTTSCLFLVSYLTYHVQVGSVRFPLQGTIRSVYLGILATHTVLAAAVPPLAILTLRRGLRDDRARHRKIARWTLPIWLYVSVTGVVIYWLLYQVAGAA